MPLDLPLLCGEMGNIFYTQKTWIQNQANVPLILCLLSNMNVKSALSNSISKPIKKHKKNIKLNYREAITSLGLPAEQ